MKSVVPTFLVWTLLPLSIQAGDLDAPSSPDNSASRMPGIEDVYQRLSTGGGDASPSGVFAEPVTGPASTGHTLQEVMDSAPSADNISGASPSTVQSGAKFWGLRTDGSWGTQTGTMPNNGSQNFIPGTTAQSVNAGYHDGTGEVSGDTDLIPAFIRKGRSIFTVNGTLIPSGVTASPEDVTSGKTFFGINTTDWTPQVGTAQDFECDLGFFDLNGDYFDMCEFQLDTLALYVSVDDPFSADGAQCGKGPSGTRTAIGSNNYPCLSIAGAMANLQPQHTKINVANGTYVETVTLVDGINLHGGFSPTVWSRDAAQTRTIIRPQSATGHKKTIIAQSITTATSIDGLILYGEPATQASTNSYVLWAVDSPGLSITNNVFYAANGADGSAGADGSNGPDGANGSQGLNYSTTCSAASGGSGGSLFCSATNVSGGNGGGTQCPPVVDTQASALNGSAGENPPGSGDAGLGGVGSTDEQVFATFCTVSSLPDTWHGDDGGNGTNGSSGSSGIGANIAIGMISANEWIGVQGGNAGPGTHGGGGGGGGAGGGFVDQSGTVEIDDSSGGTGGGAGTGGCGAPGGIGGAPGGGSFAVFIDYTTANGNAVTIQGNQIVLGSGGTGGTGGRGGIGGIGGIGATGGTGLIVAPTCGFYGGQGGDGGRGGPGGGGGGGAGGVSYGVATRNMTPGTDYTVNNDFSGGSAGVAGPGGSSYGTSGSSGVAGDMSHLRTF